MAAERVAAVLEAAGAEAAVLSALPSVADATGFYPRWDAWPGHNPHVLDPTLAVVGAGGAATLLLPGYYFPYADGVAAEVALVPSSSPTERIDQAAELAAAVAERTGPTVGRLAFEPRSLPVLVREAIAARIRVGAWVDVGPELERARARKSDEELAGMARAARVADLVQRTVKEEARPGVREVDLASECLARAWAAEGERFPILLQLKAGPDTAVRGRWHPGPRRMEPGDLVCTDVAPWLDGFWSDSCNAVAVGEPDARQRAAFEAVGEALQTALDALRPGARAADVDRQVRERLRRRGFAYPHHTGHGLGRSRFEAPLITPASEDVLEAGHVVALEPGLYVEGWAGFRHEHVAVVRDSGPELLTRFAHTL